MEGEPSTFSLPYVCVVMHVSVPANTRVCTHKHSRMNMGRYYGKGLVVWWVPPEVGVLVVVENGVYWYSAVRGTPALVSLGLEDVRYCQAPAVCVHIILFCVGL